jgi:hypothetical protein
MDPDWNAVTVLGGLSLLVYYEIHRKFKQDKPKGAMDFLERNWPRILFTAVLIPGTGQVLTDWIVKLLN